MNRHAFTPATLLPLLLVAACQEAPVQPEDAVPGADLAPQAAVQAKGSDNDPAVDVYRVALSPLNDSGVHGTATVKVQGDQLVVRLNAVDHVPDMLHAQHIHGHADGTDATCPPPEAAGGDGVLSFTDGLPFYGPVQLLLEPFPTPANAAGSMQYRESFLIGDLAFAASDLALKTFVLHGDFVDGVPVGSLPVACGTVEPVN